MLALLSVAHAAAPPAGTRITNQATSTYVPNGYIQSETVSSETVVAVVQSVEALQLLDNQTVNRSPSVQVSLPHQLTNLGNVASTYTFSLTNLDSTVCPGDTAELASLRLVHDRNSDGIAQPGEPILSLDMPGQLRLSASDSVDLVVVGNTPGTATQRACVKLTATTDASGLVSSNTDQIVINDLAVLPITKSASRSSVSAGDQVVYTITAHNIGVRPALPSGTGPLGEPVVVNGATTSLILLRDVIPAGLDYVEGSLTTAHTGAVLLYRWRNDPAFTYHTTTGGNPVEEVAIGFKDAIGPNVSVSFNFTGRVQANPPQWIVNQAATLFNDSTSRIAENSNRVSLGSITEKVGIAKRALGASRNVNPQGERDGTLTIPFQLRVKGYGSRVLHDVQVSDLLEGTTRMGSYTANALPSAGQYTIVPDSLQVTDAVGGSSATVNSAYTGMASASSLLLPGARLTVGGEFTIRFSVRLNTTGVADTIYNSATAQAAVVANGPLVLSDVSQNGSNPDADNDNNPTNNNEPTPVQLALPDIDIAKSVSKPQRVAGTTNQFEMTWRIQVSNVGTVPATFIRVADNLECTFLPQDPDSHFTAWALLGTPTAQNKLLNINANFTGRALCDKAMNAQTDPRIAFPTTVSLSITDGTRSLAPGAVEVLLLKVRATVKPSSLDSTVDFKNRAYAGTFSSSSLNQNGSSEASMLAAAVSEAQGLLIDPSGVVYNSQTRAAVAGATVKLIRESCSSSPVTPITPEELQYGSDTSTFSYDSKDGSVSMVTGPTGEYSFYFLAPPVNDLCVYRLQVVPPTGSGLSFTSVGIPPQETVFTTCGAVAPSLLQPNEGEPTQYHLRVTAGLDKVTSQVCEVFQNHIPLDPPATGSLLLKKTASKTEVELVDFLNYTLELSNKTIYPITGLKFSDTLPNGFSYVPGSLKFNGQTVADPKGQGPTVVFDLDTATLAVDAKATLTYRVKVSVGAVIGDAINRATAYTGNFVSNEASVKVRVTGGVFADEAFLFGKVYLTCERPEGGAEKADVGIPGVRILLQDGTSAITDSEGKWSLYGLKPMTHVVRLDQTTLPKGAQILWLDNRNAQQPESRFADLRKGEWHKANFPVDGCTDPSVLEEVNARRGFLQAKPGTEGDVAVLRQRLDLNTRTTGTTANVQGLPNSGLIKPGQTGITAEPVRNTPLVQLPSIMGQSVSPVAGSAAAPGFVAVAQPQAQLPVLELPIAAPASTEPLEDVLLQLDAALGFINLKDKDTLPSSTANVRVKGPLGANFALKLNGEPISERRVGKRSSLESKGVAAWEYIGVQLKAGDNTLELSAVDSFGNSRSTSTITVRAPGELARLEVDLPPELRADPMRSFPVRLRLTDASGVPVTTRTQLTLEVDRGRWVVEDLNPQETGVQIFMEGGQATLELVPPSDAGEALMRLSAGSLVRDVRLQYLPDLRPMIGVGIIEATLDLRGKGLLPLGAARARDSFEREIQGWSRQSSDGSTEAAGRLAFYFKGAVKGEYLLTAAFDSDKMVRDRMFRDIQPDRFYPVYGDASVKGFDAQSIGKLFVRVDKNRSFALFGDFTTASSAEVRQLTQTSRSLSGIRHVYEDEKVRVSSFASRDSLRQQVLELRANGTSGPYDLAISGELVAGSERVEIVVRDRNQPSLVLSTTPLASYSDYTIDPLTKRLIFSRPVSSIDLDLNPRSIRVTFETETGGEQFWVAGTDVQAKVTENLQLGAVASIDNDPANKRTLTGLTALAKLGDNTVLTAEVGRTTSDKLQAGAEALRTETEGRAARVELRHESKDLRVSVQAIKATQGFDNPGAPVTGGREEVTARGEYRFDADNRLTCEAIYSKEETTDKTRLGGSVALVSRINQNVQTEVGVRVVREEASATPAPGTSPGVPADYTSLRGKLTYQPVDSPRTRVYGEVEQSVNDSRSQVVAVGGDHQLTESTRLYGRYELISSLQGRYSFSGSDQTNVALIGVENAFLGTGRAYNEFRLRDTINGREAQNALGVRNNWLLQQGLRIGAGFERTTSAGKSNGNSGSGSGSANVLTGSVEYQPHDRLLTTASLELRMAEQGDSVLQTLGAAYKLDSTWSMLGRSSVYWQEGQNDQEDKVTMRQQIGMAYRPVDTDTWNALGRYEHRYEGGGGAAAADTVTHILSGHLHYQPRRDLRLSSRLAFKYTMLDADGLKSSDAATLLFNRITYDLDERWDMSAQFGIMAGRGGSRSTGFGAEVGYQVSPGLWISAGYNWRGLHDRVLTAGQYTDRGVYVRLRFKFDETDLGFKNVSPSRSYAPAAAVLPRPETARLAVERPASPIGLTSTTPAEPPPALIRKVLKAEALFDFNQSLIKPSAHAVLAEVVRSIAEFDVPAVLVIGHTDATGNADYNLKLSHDRAFAVRQYLISAGIQHSRIKAIGKGETEPLISNATDQGRERNRRVEIVVSESEGSF